ncbi:uncharacterized protein LOC115768652 isoform X1 [Drosophila novamexicana]|uniref:uncharacterized protein LOC115768652 isoform X1 n=1 Tax=Drosophila novamexicana TaxID=47314 RepID=UPI0011E5F7D5|nr:uncharacterized protein LOC115768652 isoform X1 [Drosophila novamexicana]
MQEYISLGRMLLVTNNQTKPQFHLPHHWVEKPDSKSTKLRIVFDGSAKSTSGASLNDLLLLAGPPIQPKIFNILLRFRLFKVAVCADIKMHRCVRITPPDQFLQCILWRENPRARNKTYSSDTVTYGTKPAAFLAIHTMQQLTYNEEHNFPLAAKIIRLDFYVDDLISGGDSIEEASKIRHQKIQVTWRYLRLATFSVQVQRFY